MISRRAFLLGTSALVAAPFVPAPPALAREDWSWFWREAVTVFADEEYLNGKWLIYPEARKFMVADGNYVYLDLSIRIGPAK